MIFCSLSKFPFQGRHLQREPQIIITPYCVFVRVVFQKEELGRLLINIFAVVPGGVVCFFSSYDYEQQVYTHWQTTGLLDKMNARKKVSFCVLINFINLRSFFDCAAFYNILLFLREGVQRTKKS